MHSRYSIGSINEVRAPREVIVLAFRAGDTPEPRPAGPCLRAREAQYLLQVSIEVAQVDFEHGVELVDLVPAQGLLHGYEQPRDALGEVHPFALVLRAQLLGSLDDLGTNARGRVQPGKRDFATSAVRVRGGDGLEDAQHAVERGEPCARGARRRRFSKLGLGKAAKHSWGQHPVQSKGKRELLVVVVGRRKIHAFMEYLLGGAEGIGTFHRFPD